MLTLIIRSVFEEDGNLYQQVFFRWCFVWIIKMLQYETIDVSEGIDANNTSGSKKCIWFVIIGILKMLDLNLNHMFAINVIMFWWLLMN